MLRIFISYSRENQAIVASLVKDLGKLGHNVWIDERVKGGQEWWDEILSRIRECDLFILSLSKETEKSQACSLELKYASDLGKLILPVLIADSVSMNLFPESISKKQYVDYRKQDKDAFIDLHNALENLPTTPPLSEPLPEPPEVPISYIDKLKDEIVTTDSLSFPEQTEIVTKLRHRIGLADELADIRYLLNELKKRDDLYERVARDIEDLLSKIHEQASETSKIAKEKKPYQPSTSRNDKKKTFPKKKPEFSSKVPVKTVVIIVILTVFACLCVLLGLLNSTSY